MQAQTVQIMLMMLLWICWEFWSPILIVQPYYWDRKTTSNIWMREQIEKMGLMMMLWLG